MPAISNTQPTHVLELPRTYKIILFFPNNLFISALYTPKPLVPIISLPQYQLVDLGIKIPFTFSIHGSNFLTATKETLFTYFMF